MIIITFRKKDKDTVFHELFTSQNTEVSVLVIGSVNILLVKVRVDLIHYL